MDLGALGDLAKQMQNAYGEGLSEMNTAGEEATKDISPTHEIEVHINLQANVEGKEYKVDSNITFELDLESILNTQGGDIAGVLAGLNVDLGENKDAVIEQLGQPRAVGRVIKINTKKISVFDKEKEIDTDLNEKGTILATLKGEKLHFNFDSVLSFPEHTDAFVAIPSTEKMQEEIIVKTKDLTKKTSFSWVERDKDNLKVEGTLKIIKI